jgi:hypothetical protein
MKNQEVFKGDIVPKFRGRIVAQLVNPETGEVVKAWHNNNVITYEGSDIMAKLLGGDTSFLPRDLGYIYAPSGETMLNPDSASPKREHTFSDIQTDIEAVSGNMIISPVGNNPDFLVDGDPTLFNHNAVTISAISDSAADLVFSPSLGFASDPPTPTTDKYFQVVLLNRRFVSGSPDPVFVPFARAQLAAGNEGIVVQSGLQLAIFWTFTFN